MCLTQTGRDEPKNHVRDFVLSRPFPRYLRNRSLLSVLQREPESSVLRENERLLV